MVRTYTDKNVSFLLRATNKIFDLWGKDYTVLRQGRTINQFGELTEVTETTIKVKGDLQYGPYLDQKLVEAGIVNQGEAVFYYILGSADLDLQDIVYDAENKNEGRFQIVEFIETGDWTGISTHIGARCIRIGNTDGAN